MQDFLNLYFREVVYHNPKAKKDSVCGVFSYEAFNIEEARLGNLYLVGRITGFSDKKHKNFDFLLNLLSSAIKREFYSDAQRGTMEALESSLQSANIYLSDFAKKGHKEWIGNIDFTCIAFSQNSIHIGQTGNMSVFLLRKDRLTNITRKFSGTTIKDPSKTFSNIASGSLEEGDKLVVSTANISDIVSQVKLKELLYHSTGEIFYNFLTESLENQEKQKQTINSLACLILEAQIKPPVIEKKIVKKQKESPQNTKINLERLLKNKSIKAYNLIKIKTSNNKNLSKVSQLFKYHSPKYLVLLFLFFLIVLSPYLIQKFIYDSKIAKAENLIKRTNQIIEQSEVSLVYQDQETSKGLLQQASVMITTASGILNPLPEKAKEEPMNEVKDAEEKLNNQKNTINNIVNIQQPEILTDLAQNSFSFNPAGILRLEDMLYLYELSSGFIYKINLNDINNPTLIFLSSKDTFKMGVVKENSIILLSSPEKIYVYSKNDNYNTYLLKPDLENTLNIKDMVNYGDNFYFLDAEKLNIWKYIPEANSIVGEGWLNDKYREELIDSISMAIDGSIYVSKKDGTIIEFVSGSKKSEFKPDVSPELSTGSKMFTSPDMKNLYVLDPENNRIISINKTDKTTTQYVSSEFNELRNLWVDQDERTIYLINGLKILRINI